MPRKTQADRVAFREVTQENTQASSQQSVTPATVSGTGQVQADTLAWSIRWGRDGFVRARWGPLALGEPVMDEAREDREELVVRVRLEGSRLRICELWFRGGTQPIGVRRLRELPLLELEALLNVDDGLFYQEARERGPDTDPLKHFEFIAELLNEPFGDEHEYNRTAPPARVPLQYPKRLDETFLEALAAAYVDYVRRGLPPAPSIAAEVGHPNARTVHGWISKARAGGYLPPGVRGRAG